MRPALSFPVMQLIFKDNPDRNFTILPNALIMEPSLSLQAKALLLMVLSLPPTWETKLDWLIKQHTGGRVMTQRAIKELETAGYLLRVPISVSGRKSLRWLWSSTPHDCRFSTAVNLQCYKDVLHKEEPPKKKQRSERQRKAWSKLNTLPERWTPACNLGMRFDA